MAVLAKEHRAARGRLDSDHDPEEEWREEDQGHRRCDNIKSALRVRRCWFATRKAAPAADLISASSHVTYRSRRNKLLRLPDRRDVILDRMRCSCRRHQFRSRLNVASTTTLNCSDAVTISNLESLSSLERMRSPTSLNDAFACGRTLSGFVWKKWGGKTESLRTAHTTVRCHSCVRANVRCTRSV